MHNQNLTIANQRLGEIRASQVAIKLIEAMIDVANLEVERDHYFYVFDGKIGYLVHNSGGGGGGGGK